MVKQVNKLDDLKAAVDALGFALKRNFLSPQEINALTAACLPIRESYGERDVLNQFPLIYTALPWKKISALLHSLGFQEPVVARSLFFNKTASNNWLVAWHQDKTICLRDRFEHPSFSKWTIKDHILHVEPPVEVLQNMLTLRFALDDIGEENGALKVIPGSHRFGKLNTPEIEKIARDSASNVCSMSSGDVFLMKPLLLHASEKAKAVKHRRVIHLEIAERELPHFAQWANPLRIANLNHEHSLTIA